MFLVHVCVGRVIGQHSACQLAAAEASCSDIRNFRLYSRSKPALCVCVCWELLQLLGFLPLLKFKSGAVMSSQLTAGR